MNEFQQYGPPFTKADIDNVTAECPICQKWRPTLSFLYGTIPHGEPATWKQLDQIGPLP